MPWYCNGCGRERGGTQCKKWCREKYGDMGATRWPPLDGMVHINDDGTCIMGIDQYIYDLLPCKRDQHPRVTHGPRPPGWFEALRVIGERAARVIEDGVRQGVVLPCGSD